MQTVKLSNVDRLINFHQSLELNEIKNVNNKILQEQIFQNNELRQLNQQLSIANQFNKQILLNQIREIEYKETQKFYKALSFKMHEIVSCLEKIKDPFVKKYFVDRYSKNISENTLLANQKLDEISDKVFTKEIINRAQNIISSLGKHNETYKTSPFIDIDIHIKALNNKSQEISKLQPPLYKEENIKVKRKNSMLRFIPLCILGFFTFMTLLLTIMCLVNSNNSPIDSLPLFYFIFVLPFLIILYKDIKWRKSYPKYLFMIDEKKKLLHSKFKDSYAEYLIKKETLSQELFKSNAYVLIENINFTFPEFNNVLSDINEIENI